MRFRDTYLYAHLKQASYTGGLIASGIDRVPYGRQTREVVQGVGGDAANIASGILRRGGPTGPFTAAAEDAGRSLGQGLGDMFGKINTDSDEYEDREIIRLLNQQEEILLLEREAERLERLARIQARKKKRMNDAAARAVRSPFI